MCVASRRYSFFYIWCIFITCATGYAQTLHYNNIRFKKYSVEHGLTSGACNNIYRDSYGFLWISNYYGVSIFNGSHFFNLPMFTEDEGFDLSLKPHYFLQMDSISMLISAPSGLYNYDYTSHTVTRLVKQPIPISRDRIQLLGLSVAGHELYAQSMGKLYTLDRSLNLVNATSCIDENPRVRVKNIGTHSEYFYLSATNRLIRVNLLALKTDTLLTLADETSTMLINAESETEYLLCTDHRIYRIEKKTGTVITSLKIPASYSKNMPFRLGAAAMDQQHNYLVSGSDRLFIYFPRENRIHDITNSKDESSITDIKINGDEIYLAALTNSGIFISDKTAGLVKNHDWLTEAPNSVSAMFIHNKKLVTDGTGGALKVIDQEKPETFTRYRAFKESRSFFVQFENLDDNHIWFINWNNFELGIINTQSFTVIQHPFVVNNLALAYRRSFRALLPTKETAPNIRKMQKDLYYYSLSNQLYKIEGNIRSGFRLTFIDSISSSQYFTSIDKLASGALMIGTSNREVYSLQNDRLTKRIHSSNQNIPVRYVLGDNRNNSYLLTTNGIYIYDSLFYLKNHLTVQNNQLPGNIMYSRFIDNRNLLWATTSAGVIVYDCSGGNLFKLSAFNAISNTEFNTRCMVVDDRQQVYFGGSKGITAINTNLFANTKRDFQLFLFSIKNQDSLLHSRLLPGSVVEKENFPYYKNSFSFSVYVISTLRAEPFEMRYMLENLDTVWRVAKGNSIEFTGLKPGKYKLRVKGKYPGSKLNREISYSFKINPPFWRQSWFLSVAIIAGGIPLYLLVQLWQRKKMERKRMEAARQLTLKTERMRISQELHDDMGSGLTAIRLLCKSASARPNSPNIPTMLADIGTVTGELTEQMSEIIWVLSHSDDTLNGLMNYLHAYMTNFLKRVELPMKLHYNNTIKVDYSISSIQRRNILLVAKESFHNSVKYSGADAFSIDCSIRESSTLHIIISDNGKGINEDAAPTGTGNGLKNMKKRMTSINGTLAIENDNGTKIIIDIPIHKES